MKPKPTGKLECVDGVPHLVMIRTFRAPIEDVWASLTESNRTARWIGPWTGEGKPGATVMLDMTEEDEGDGQPVVIQRCEPPRHLSLELGSETESSWFVSAELSHEDGVTTVEFRQILRPEDSVADMGAGWDFYLDRFVAASGGESAGDWPDYHPALVSHYEDLDAAFTCP